RVRRGREPVVHGPALVGLYVSERDPAQRGERCDARRGGGYEWEERAPTRVEEQGLVARDEVLVEAEVGILDVGRQLVDAVGDFGDSGLHQNGTSWVSRPVPAARPERIRQNSTASRLNCSPWSP